PYRIDTHIGNWLSGRLHKRRNILPYQRTSGNERMRADTDKLMHGHHSGKHHIIADGNMTGQGATIRKNTVVAHDTIVRNMAISLNQTVFTYHRLPAVFRPAVDGYAFANRGIVAYFSSRFFPI